MEPLLSLEAVGALLLGPSCLTDESRGPLLDGGDSEPGPPSPLCCSGALSPICSSTLAAEELLLAWPTAELEPSAGDAFSGMDWMAEKLDLNDFDLDSLIGSCDSDEPPSSPEELLACLDMDLGLDSVPLSPPHPGLSLDSALLGPSDPALGLHSAPLGPSDPDPALGLHSAPLGPSDPDPALGLHSVPLGPSDVGPALPPPEPVLEIKAEPASPEPPVLMLDLSPAHIVVLLGAKEELSSDPSDSDSGISVSGSPSHSPHSSRTKPYSRPDPSPRAKPKGAERKLKKMEQNKTAATRYRQKKREEQETLNAEAAVLEQRNRELGEKAQALSREIQYLKDLMEEVRAKRRRTTAPSQDKP